MAKELRSKSRKTSHSPKIKSGIKKIQNNVESIKELKLRSNRLPVQFRIIVPSTKGDKEIPEWEFQRRIDSERKYLIKMFGGDTTIQAQGGYADDKKVIFERNAVVEISTTKEMYNHHRKRLVSHIRKRRKQWKQDTLAYAVEGNFYVYPRKPYIKHDKEGKNIRIE